MQKKIIFIIPHFGKFNNYFSIWLQSCRYNPSINWLIFTDDQSDYDYPENVKVIYTTFGETVKLFQSKFDFPIVLKTPYLLCEFRIAYGEIYADYIKDFDFWGYCDTDVIWGNLSKHISAEILDTYYKIGWRGHMTLFKNDERINKLYKTKIDGLEYYKYAFANSTGFPLATDERLINHIIEKLELPVYKEIPFADLKIRSFNFFLHHFSPQNDYKNTAQIFLWNEGDLIRLYVHNEQIFSEDFAYIHFLKRPMAVKQHFVPGNRFLIVPNKFVESNVDIDSKFIIKQSKPKIYWSYYLSKISMGYLFNKLKYIKSKKQFKETIKLPLAKTYDYQISSTPVLECNLLISINI